MARYKYEPLIIAAPNYNSRTLAQLCVLIIQVFSLSMFLYALCVQVIGFLKAVIKRLVPLELWGSEYNRRLFYGHLKTFVQLRRRETVSVKQLCAGMKACCLFLYTHTHTHTHRHSAIQYEVKTTNAHLFFSE